MDERRQELERLHSTEFARLVRTAAWLVGDIGTAEEIVQESFVRLARSWPELKNADAGPAYLRRIVVNLCNTRLRRIIVGRRKLMRVGESLPQVDHSALALGDGLLDGEVGRAIRRLPNRQRTCVVLRFEQDLTIDQIAETLRIAPGSVKSHLHRAIEALRTDLETEASS